MSVIHSISLYRGYLQDNRRSMEIYSKYLLDALRARLPDVPIREILPQMPEWIGSSANTMRVLRYLVYPCQAPLRRGNINHITEGGYAHLIPRLDPARTVVTVHDLIPLLSWRGLIPGLRYPHAPRLFAHSVSYLKRCAAVIAPSECVRREIIEHCGCRAADVHVVHHGVDARFRPLPPEERAEQRRLLGLPPDDALVLISGGESYKNHETSTLVYERARTQLRRRVRLVRVGRRPAGAPRAGGDSEQSTIELGQRQPQAMVGIYNAVDCLLFPSWYEGFGWPPLEAMACGVPVVASNAGSLPEIVGDAGYVCAPDGVQELADRVCEAIEDGGGRARLIEKGLARAQQFSWERSAARIHEVYSGIANGAV